MSATAADDFLAVYDRNQRPNLDAHFVTPGMPDDGFGGPAITGYDNVHVVCWLPWSAVDANEPVLISSDEAAYYSTISLTQMVDYFLDGHANPGYPDWRFPEGDPTDHALGLIAALRAAACRIEAHLPEQVIDQRRAAA